MMSELPEECDKQQNTAYGEFIQASWARYLRLYPDELIHKEIEEFHKQCSFSWVNFSEQERESFQEMADRSNVIMMSELPHFVIYGKQSGKVLDASMSNIGMKNSQAVHCKYWPGPIFQ